MVIVTTRLSSGMGLVLAKTLASIGVILRANTVEGYIAARVRVSVR